VETAFQQRRIDSLLACNTRQENSPARLSSNGMEWKEMTEQTYTINDLAWRRYSQCLIAITGFGQYEVHRRKGYSWLGQFCSDSGRRMDLSGDGNLRQTIGTCEWDYKERMTRDLSTGPMSVEIIVREKK
jgi:hypothetical protein